MKTRRIPPELIYRQKLKKIKNMNPLIEAIVRTDTPSDKNFEIDFQATADALRQIKDRFIDERTNGWTRPDTGQHVPGVPREEAEARWAMVAPRFEKSMYKGAGHDSETNRKLRTGGKSLPASSAYVNEPEGEEAPGGADFDKMQADWNTSKRNLRYQRRGESLVSSVVRKMIT